MTARTVVLLRHAKADTPHGVADADRPLTERGRADAVAAGRWLVRRELVPGLVLCSPARRTRETWQAAATALAEAGMPDPAVRFEPVLYTGGAGTLLDQVRAVPDTVHTLLVVGHNPTVSDASCQLEPDDPVGGFTGLRTCEAAVHRCIGPWAKLSPHTTDLIDRHVNRAGH